MTTDITKIAFDFLMLARQAKDGMSASRSYQALYDRLVYKLHRDGVAPQK
jgi:hypothetical protein